MQASDRSITSRKELEERNCVFKGSGQLVLTLPNSLKRPGEYSWVFRNGMGVFTTQMELMCRN